MSRARARHARPGPAPCDPRHIAPRLRSAILFFACALPDVR